jgi:hypothetical protein
MAQQREEIVFGLARLFSGDLRRLQLFFRALAFADIATFDAPITFPAAALLGEALIDTSISRPSFRTRTVSK